MGFDDVAALVALAALALSAGCAAWMGSSSAPSVTQVVLWFEEFDEVFTGTATRSGLPLTGAFLDVTNHHGDLRCVGNTEVRIVPPGVRPPKRCDGMRAVSALTCSDGRQLLMEFVMEEGCGRGYGRGRDQKVGVLQENEAALQPQIETVVRF